MGVPDESSGHSEPVTLQSPTQAEKHNLDQLVAHAAFATLTNTEARDAILAAHAQRQALAHEAQELRDEANAREKRGEGEFVEVRRSRKRSAEKPAWETPNRGATRVDARTDRELTETERRSSRTRKVSYSNVLLYESVSAMGRKLSTCKL